MRKRSNVPVTILPDGRLSRADAAKFLGLSTKTLAERQRKGLPPESVKVGGRRYYYLDVLERFIESGR